MFTRTRNLGIWKYKRWKYFSTLQRSPSTALHTIVTINTEITRRAKDGNLEIARQLFDEMPRRTVVSWNIMLAGYSKWGLYSEALNLVGAMHGSHMKFNESTFLTTLSACARSWSLFVGKQIHGLVLKSGFECYELLGSTLIYFYASCARIDEARLVFDIMCERNPMVWSSLLVGYVQCNMMDDAVELFMRMPSDDVLSWTTLISGYSKQDGGSEKALQLFQKMRKIAAVQPNEYTLDCVLRVCARLSVLCQGQGIHGLVIKCGFEHDQSICSALIDLYSACQAVHDGERVYTELRDPSLEISNSLIGGYISMGRLEDAELLFNRLPKRDPVSYNLMIKAYAMYGRIDASKELFDQMPLKTIVSVNTMISAYSDMGEIDNARKLFDSRMSDRNSVTWNSMISSHIQNDQHEEAIKLYVVMHRLSIEKTRSTFSSLFHACSSLECLQQGKLIHAQLTRTPFQSNVYVGTSLVDMYAKCGSISDAQRAFDAISLPNVAAWTALINGHAHHGLGSEAFVHFEHMVQQGVSPNGATFVGILLACGRAGMVDEGMQIFHSMKNCYGLAPTLEHYACVVDLLGRAGHLLEAEQFIRDMQVEADAVIWGALLNASWFWMDVDVGLRVCKKVFTLDPKSSYAYVIMSNMYARAERWGDKTRLRKILRGLDVNKDPAYSWLELDNRIHLFSVEDRFHTHCNLIYMTLDNLTQNVKQCFHHNDASSLTTEAYKSSALCLES
uniref:Uncharacterized protein n=1 Tax=Opuntia streptacantha TaxID=393608 RepID=A0A7C9AUE1_OPUST